ncbi:MAG: hypothetical protein HXY49_09550 [Ignavibacteriaceae bacterium]|jgi:hypothetical protein|nr:hypothetical protein [Ignavibacteriaceae bacterium]
MKKTTKKRAKSNNKKSRDVVILLSEWENVDEYSQEEIDDLVEEFHIPEISYIEPIEEPEELKFDWLKGK